MSKKQQDKQPSENLGFFLPEAKYELMKSLQDEIKNAEKTLKNAVKLTQNCYIIDKMNIKMQNEIGGISIQEAFKNELARAQKEKSGVEQLIEKAADNIHAAEMLICDLQYSVKIHNK